jgi:hypothetical protein
VPTSSADPRVEKVTKMVLDDQILTVCKTPKKKKDIIGKILLSNDLNTNKVCAQKGNHNFYQYAKKKEK